MEQSSKPARKVAIADHIWDAFDEMAASMGTDRDSLINQAMFVFARLNGFIETAAELERLIKGKNSNNAQQAEPSVEEPAPEEDVGMDVEESEPAPAEEEGGSLYLMAEGGELDKIAKDRFVIGRGKHCDFVINSGKVSHEHAVIVREGSDFYIEDLGSSNGTWFNKQRIKRRKVEDGDEYFICSEKIKLVRR